MAGDYIEVRKRRPSELVARDTVAAFQLASDDIIVDATPALLKLIDPHADRPINGSSFVEFWHRHFVRPVADTELLAALRNVGDQAVIEASPACASGEQRTLQLRPVDNADDIVTVVVTDISALIEAQVKLMRTLADERFVHLVTCDLITSNDATVTNVTHPDDIISGIANALGTYFTLTLVAVTVPATMVALPPHTLGFWSRRGGKFDDYTALLFELGLPRTDIAASTTSSAPGHSYNAWTTPLTPPQRHLLGVDGLRLGCVSATSPAGLEMVALCPEEQLGAVDRNVIRQTLNRIGHFHRARAAERILVGGAKPTDRRSTDTP